MKEKDFQSKFGKWIKEHKETLDIIPAVYELKLEKGNSFAFDKVKEHQIKALLEAKHIGLYHKIADQTIGKGGKFGMTLKKPFDCFYVKGIKSFVVIGFYTPRQKIEAVFMDIDKFIETRKWYLDKGKKSAPKEHWKQMSNKFFRI
jgi:hypothetical protein